MLSYQLDLVSRTAAPMMANEALRGQTHTWTLDASYGITPWLTGELVLPFAFKSQQVGSGTTATGSRSTGGVADPLALLKLTIWGHHTPRPGALRVGLLGGIKFPLGSDDASDSGATLPASFQVSSGSMDYLAGAYYSVGLLAKTSLYGSVVARLTTRNKQGYRFGHTVTGTTDFSVFHLWPVTFAAGLRASGATMDEERGQQTKNSGGWMLSGHLGVGYYPWDSLFFNLDAIIPMHKDLEGNQLASDMSLMLGVNWLL